MRVSILFDSAGRDPVEHVYVRNSNHPLCGCAVFVIQKNHLSVIIRLFKPIYNERKGDFNGQKGKQFSTHEMDV